MTASGILASTGDFYLDPAHGNGWYITVSGMGFQPIVTIFEYSGILSSGEITTSGNILSIIGIGTGAGTGYQTLLSAKAKNNVTSSPVGKEIENTYCIESNGALVKYGYISDGIRVMQYNQPNQTSRITYLSLGGDIKAYIGSYTTPTTTGYITVTTVPFQPQAIIDLTAHSTSYGSSTTFKGSLGWATSSGEQSAIAYNSSTAVPADVVGWGWNNNISADVSLSKTFTNRISFVEMLPSGFRLNQNTTGSAFIHTFLALAGGNFKIGNIITTTGYAIINTDVGFEPDVVLFLSATRPLASGISDHFSYSLSERIVTTNKGSAQAGWYEDNVNPTEASISTNNSIYTNVKHHTVQGRMDFYGLIKNGFSTVMTIPDSTENWISYLAIGGYGKIRDSKSAFLYGKAFSNQPSYTYGHSLNGLEIHAYLKGKDTSNSSKSAFMRGGVVTTSLKSAYTEFGNLKIASNTGYFVIDTTKTIGQTQSITGLDFQPKLILLWWTGIYTGGGSGHSPTYDYWTDSTCDLNIGFGAGKDSSSRFCVVGYDGDNLSITNTLRSQSNTEILRTYTTSGVLDGILDLASLDSNGVTFTIDDQFSRPYVVGYLAIGGSDLTNIYIGNGTFPTATGIFDVTGIGFQPDAVIFITQSQTSLPQSSDDALLSLGFTANNKQGLISYYSKDNSTDSVTKHYSRNDELYAIIDSSLTVISKGTFDSFLSDGFRLNNLRGTSPNIFNYIALKGGKYTVVDFISGYQTGITYTVSGVGFKPTTLIMMSPVNDMNSVDTIGIDAEISMGFTTSYVNRDYNQIAQYSESYDNYGTSSVYTGYSDLSYFNAEYWGLIQVTGFNEDGFTYIEPNYDNANFITFLAIGEGGSVVSSKSAYLNCSNIITSNKSAFLEGTTINARVSHSAYTRGLNTNSTNKACFIEGSYGFEISQAYLDFPQIMPTVTSKSAYTKGGTGTINSHSAFISGENRYSKSAFTEGYSPNQSVKSAYLYGSDLKFGPDVWIS